MATQADKVLAFLEQIALPRPALEDPAERRARKFAALAARESAELDIDLTLLMPVDREFVSSESTDDAQLSPPFAFAFEPGPMQEFAGAHYAAAPVDLELEADAQGPRPSPFGGEQVAIDAKSLNRIRGGFIGDGLNISFGIERAVYINGSLVTTTSLNLSDLGRLTAGRGTTSLDSSGTLALIQSGAGNTMTSGAFSSTSIGTVVQNTLNGQKIQSVTVINATVNSLGVLRGINLQSSMRGAIVDSLRR